MKRDQNKVNPWQGASKFLLVDEPGTTALNTWVNVRLISAVQDNAGDGCTITMSNGDEFRSHLWAHQVVHYIDTGELP